MKILIMGNPKSIFMKSYVEYITANSGYEVYLSCPDRLGEDDKNFYKQNDVHLINLFSGLTLPGPFSKASTFFNFIVSLKRLTAGKEFDCLHIHSLTNSSLLQYASKYINRMFKNIIVTFWGSDILDISEKTAKSNAKILDVSRYIVLSTEEMRKKFRGYYGKKYDKKIISCLFGNAVISKYLSLKNENKDVRLSSDVFIEKHQIPKDKLIISVGYNSSKRQQHIKALTALASLPAETLKNIYCILQMSYGSGDEKYMNEITTFMKKKGIDGKILKSWLSAEETLEFKSIVDIFIHAQTTDALSASIIEYIYMGCTVFTPSWIKYAEWEKLGLEYITFDNFEDLADKLKKQLSNYLRKRPCREVQKIIENNFSWQNQVVCWRALYK